MPQTHRLVGRRVLITEDEILVALELQQTLRDAGCEIVGVSRSLASAFALLESSEPDFAVLDINLGGEDVYPFARAIRARGIPFFFLSGYSEEFLLPEDLRDCVRLEKPARDYQILRAAAQLFVKQ